MDGEKTTGNEGSRHISMELSADGARVTNLSLEGSRLVLTIEAELSASHLTANNPANQEMLDAAFKSLAGLMEPGNETRNERMDRSDTEFVNRPSVTVPTPSSPDAPALGKPLSDHDLGVGDFSGASEVFAPPAPASAPKPRLSERLDMHEQPKSISLNDLDTPALTPPAASPLEPAAPAPISGPSSRVGGQAPVQSPIDTANLNVTSVENLAETWDPDAPPTNAPAAPSPIKELRLGGEIPLGDDMSVSAWGGPQFGPAPQPMMETWDPSSLSMGGEPGQLAMSEESAAIGGERHGEPQPAISFGLDTGAASKPPAPAAPITLDAPAAAPAISLDQPAAPALGFDAPPAAAPITLDAPAAAPAISLDQPAAPALGFDAPPAAAPISLDAPAAAPAISLDQPAAPALGFDAPPAAAPITLDAPAAAPTISLDQPAAPALGFDAPPAAAPITLDAPAAAPTISLDQPTAPALGFDAPPAAAPISLDAPAAAPAISLDQPAAPALGFDTPPAAAPISLDAPAAAPALGFDAPPAAAAISLDAPAAAPALGFDAPPAAAPISLDAPTAAPAISLDQPAAPALGFDAPPAAAPIGFDAPAGGSGIGFESPPAPKPAPLSGAVDQEAPTLPNMTPPADQPPASSTQDKATETGAGGTTVLIRYTCPKCKTQGMQAVDKVGTVVNCSNCGKAMRLVMKK